MLEQQTGHDWKKEKHCTQLYKNRRSIFKIRDAYSNTCHQLVFSLPGNLTRILGDDGSSIARGTAEGHQKHQKLETLVASDSVVLFHNCCLVVFSLAIGRVMSGLRRRIINAFRDTIPSPSPSPIRTGTPTTDVGEDVQLVSVKKLKELTQRKVSKRRTSLIFGLGGLFGVLIAVFFANQQDVIKLEGLMDLNLDSLIDVIPAGIVKDARDLTVMQLL